MASNQFVLEVDSIHHSYDGQQIIREVTFSVNHGEIVCLLGPSGSGKTTLLKIIAGILKPTSGKILIDGIDQTNVPAFKRNIGFVFQDSTALFPHLNVFNNIAFPFLHGRRKVKNGHWKDEVSNIIDITGLTAHAHSRIANLSGGELQRVALARALVYRPSLLILDEPLSSLDNILKRQITELLLQLHDKFKTTFLFVTHDEREVLQLATKVGIIDNTELCQYGNLIDIIKQPTIPKVAQILGQWNLYKATELTNKPGYYEINDDVFIHLSNIKPLNSDNYNLGLPYSSVQLRDANSKLKDDELSFDIKIFRVIPWYENSLYDCIVMHAGHETNTRIKCITPQSDLYDKNQLAKAIFKEEELYVF